MLFNIIVNVSKLTLARPLLQRSAGEVMYTP
jgi:hypothetical protein